MIVYGNQLSATEYRELRDAAGFRKLSQAQAERGLKNTTYLITARDGDRAVGMTRILFDYGYLAYLSDVIVLPEYQGQGIGRKLVESGIAFLKENTTEGEMIMLGLHAAEGKEPFYERFGFTRRPGDGYGAGMVLRW